MNNPQAAPGTIPCRDCSAGHMHLQNVTYYTWLVDELITVSDFPAWVCDVCGRRDYDPRSLNQLSLILSPNAGKSTTHHRTMHKRRPTPKHKPPRTSRAE